MGKRAGEEGHRGFIITRSLVFAFITLREREEGMKETRVRGRGSERNDGALETRV